MSTPFDEGVDRFHENGFIEDNPYDGLNTEDATEWREGYMHAEEKEQKEDGE